MSEPALLTRSFEDRKTELLSTRWVMGGRDGWMWMWMHADFFFYLPTDMNRNLLMAHRPFSICSFFFLSQLISLVNSLFYCNDTTAQLLFFLSFSFFSLRALMLIDSSWVICSCYSFLFFSCLLSMAFFLSNCLSTTNHIFLAWFHFIYPVFLVSSYHPIFCPITVFLHGHGYLANGSHLSNAQMCGSCTDIDIHFGPAARTRKPVKKKEREREKEIIHPPMPFSLVSSPPIFEEDIACFLSFFLSVLKGQGEVVFIIIALHNPCAKRWAFSPCVFSCVTMSAWQVQRWVWENWRLMVEHQSAFVLEPSPRVERMSKNKNEDKKALAFGASWPSFFFVPCPLALTLLLVNIASGSALVSKSFMTLVSFTGVFWSNIPMLLNRDACPPHSFQWSSVFSDQSAQMPSSIAHQPKIWDQIFLNNWAHWPNSNSPNSFSFSSNSFVPHRHTFPSFTPLILVRVASCHHLSALSHSTIVTNPISSQDSSTNHRVTNKKKMREWELMPASSIILSFSRLSTLFRPGYVNKNFLYLLLVNRSHHSIHARVIGSSGLRVVYLAPHSLSLSRHQDRTKN